MKVAPLFNGALPVPRYRPLDQMQSQIIDDAYMFCIIEVRDAPSNSSIIGFASFDRKGNPRNQDLLYAIALHPDHWSKGYGTEVTSGFVEEARQRKARWTNGQWEDTILMSICVMNGRK
ncbi:hypothetical protein BDN70DRAFT_885002 [Pholiota conissans]|uniref:N-acetyltransferase domain-containing protein n=1 Tax=Pholiota conissans TaxID=109636 RepID=A0A9P6CW66_9AGAR|nr:hypothetical protein BDN70DRAFT_885002 [Pholiota conissans]